MTRQLEFRDPKNLKPHALIGAMPQWEETDERLIALARSIQEGGLHESLKITEDGLIADGRHRWRAAKRLKLAEVACEIIADEDVATIAMDTLMGRRHLTPGQRAYACMPILKDAFEEASKRRLQNLRRGAPNAESGVEAQPLRFEDKRVETIDQFCARNGFSVRLVQMAREVSKFFEDETPRTITGEDGTPNVDVTFRDYFEPRILREEEPYGLGAVLTGIKQILDLEKKTSAGRAHAGGKPKAPERQLSLFTGTFTRDLTNRYEYWAKFDEDQKTEAILQIIPAIEKMPDDLLEALEKKLRAEAKRRSSNG